MKLECGLEVLLLKGSGAVVTKVKLPATPIGLAGCGMTMLSVVEFGVW